MMLHNHTRFGDKMFCGSEDIVQKNIQTFWTFPVTLTLNAVIPFFHRTLWLMMMYCHTKFVCKWTSSLEDIVQIVVFWLYTPKAFAVTLTLKTVNQFFCSKHRLVTIIHQHTKFGKKMVEQFKGYWAHTIGHTDRSTDGQRDVRTDGQSHAHSLTNTQHCKREISNCWSILGEGNT